MTEMTSKLLNYSFKQMLHKHLKLFRMIWTLITHIILDYCTHVRTTTDVHQSVNTTELKRNLNQKEESSVPNLHLWCGRKRRTAERDTRHEETCAHCSTYLPVCGWLRREMLSPRSQLNIPMNVEDICVLY